MSTRTERLNRLAIQPPCRESRVPLPTFARRASPLAMAVVGALLGMSGAAWAAAPGPAPSAPDLALEEKLLHSFYRESSLVAIATVGLSLPLAETAPDAWEREVRTELQVATVLKGTPPGSTVRVDRLAATGDEAAVRAGDTVLAFLTAPAEETVAPGEPAYGLVDPFGDLLRLAPDALRSYRRRLEALARLGEAPRAEELLEWLVATAEDEHTRKEVEPAVLRARLTPAHRERLARALLATERLTAADLGLYRLVRPWAGRPAQRWLAARLADDAVEPWLAQSAMIRLGEELADDGLLQLLRQAAEETAAVDDQPARADETIAARDERVAAQVEAIELELRRAFLRALDGRL